jgi:regulator of protease activity HflC (stomatin/prohibitin superfamily)
MLLELGALLLLGFIFFKYFIVIVNQNEVTVWESFGQFDSIRTAGMYLSRPWQYQKTVRWVFRHAEHTTLSKIETARIPKTTLRYDPVPLKCVTSDNFSVSIDLVVNFRIVDAKTAVYNSQNPLSELEDKLETYVYETVRKFKMVEATVEQLMRAINLEKLNDQIKFDGIMIIDLRVQGITLPAGIVDATVANEQLRLKNQADIDRIQAEREHNLKLIESKLLEQENKNRMERETVEHQNTMRLQGARTEQEVRRIQAESEFIVLEKINSMPAIVPYLVAKEQAKVAMELGKEGKGKRVIIFTDAIHSNMAGLPVAKELLSLK